MVRRYNPDEARDYLADWIVRDEGDETRAFCPLCEEPGASNSPSASFNFGDDRWNCLKTDGHGGTITKLLRDLKAQEGHTITRTTSSVRPAEPPEPFPYTEDQVEAWHDALMGNAAVLQALKTAKPFTDATLDEFMVGWDGERYTIPVWSAEGELVNIRRYRPGASSQKMLNVPGHGEAAIYGYETLESSDTILWTAGESDRLLAHQHGFPAVTHTAGEGYFNRQWAPLFKGKSVYVCYDADDSGRTGAEKVIEAIRDHADHVYRVTIPEVKRGYDVSDVLADSGPEALATLIAEAEPVGRVPAAPVPQSGIRVSLQETMAESLQDAALEIVVSVSGKQAEPYTAPKTIEVRCGTNKGTICDICPVNQLYGGHMTMDVRPDNPDLFRFVDVGEARRATLLKEITGAKCDTHATFTTPVDWHVEELLVQPSIDERTEGESERPIRRTIYSVGTYRTSTNEKVRLVGRNVPDPKSGRLRFMSWVNEQVQMDIDRFELTSELREALDIFRPESGQSALDKCMEIADDMATNVTHIYGRDLVHVGYDLVWHSVLGFNAYKTPVTKGWLEAMAVGDTRTGKSEIAAKLIGHYRSGQLLSCEGSSFAGLVGGVQQIDGRWHMTWGSIPMNDRRLVVLDEASGIKDANVIEQMSSIRSSGVAQITKISSEETSARTRLLWITNPADGTNLAESMDMGMSALRSVVRNNEDIARFDFVMALSKGEVDEHVINTMAAPQMHPNYPAVICEALIKWAWSLTVDKVHLTEGTEQVASQMAIEMGHRYVADPPLIQSENVRFKLLRIACALAARTFSIGPDDELVVKPEHVCDAARFLDLIYGSTSMGYLRKSRRILKLQAEAEASFDQVKIDLQSNGSILTTLSAVGSTTFRARDFQEFSGTAGVSQLEIEEVLGNLIKLGMIRRIERGAMVMSETLIRMLREIEDENLNK